MTCKCVIFSFGMNEEFHSYVNCTYCSLNQIKAFIIIFEHKSYMQGNITISESSTIIIKKVNNPFITGFEILINFPNIKGCYY